MSDIHFFNEEIDFELENKNHISNWIKKAVTENHKETGTINYIFCSDEYLFNLNETYLNHNTYTDIITFNNSDNENIIEGDIFISIDRIKENAVKFDSDFQNELLRVMIHGILHLIGFNDKTDDEKKEMRKIENHYLNLRN